MELFLIEEEVKSFVHTQVQLSNNEKAKRITKTLNLITEIYNKHEEELSAVDAYNILFEAKDE